MKMHIITRRITAILIAVAILLPASGSVFAETAETEDMPEVQTEQSESDAEEDPLLQTEAPLKAAAVSRKAITTRSVVPKDLGINLRVLLGEKRTGYSVAQGAGCDGTYVYYLMISSSTDKGKILKTRVSDNAVMARSDVINVYHGNGMALDRKRKRLVAACSKDKLNYVCIISTGSNESDVPAFTGYKKVTYPYSGNWTGSKKYFDGLGLVSITYVEKYDCYIALQRITRDLLVLNPDFQVIGFIKTKILEKYPGTFQAIDADEKYVYLVLSPRNSKQNKNIVLVLDWHGDKMASVAAGKAKYVKDAWKCGSNGSPAAVINTQTKYEAENLYHIDQGDGTARFYLSEYFNDPTYHYVTKKKAYKVRWKKVKKRVKWKRVKKNGRWKWKYKKKKVWKYKKKYKKVKVREVKHFKRQNYVYDLGVM